MNKVIVTSNREVVLNGEHVKVCKTKMEANKAGREIAKKNMPAELVIQSIYNTKQHRRGQISLEQGIGTQHTKK